jgi:hypothetical protein
MTHPRRFGDVRHWLGRGWFAKRLSQAFRAPSFLSTSGLWLAKTFLAANASEASFVQDVFNLMLSQRSLALLSRSRIMDLHPRFLTRGTGCLGGRGDHVDSDRAIRLPFLLENMPFRQTQRHDYSFSSDGIFCGMLAWQGLFSLT